MTSLVALLLAAGCRDPGWIRGPLGGMPVRTARYRVAPRENRDELLLFLSTSTFDSCSIPHLPNDQAQATEQEALLRALCREQVQHLLLEVFTRDGDWGGSFLVIADAQPRDVGISVPPFVRGGYYAVEEASLVQVRDMRLFAPRSFVAIEHLSAGEITLDQDLDRLTGTFDVDGVAGELDAEPCGLDTSLLETIVDLWDDNLCQ